MSDVATLIKIRDGTQMIADGLTELKIAWQEATGARGIYFRANPQVTVDFRNMLQDIKNHGGKLNRDGYFYWVFQDAATAGRKKR